MRNLLLLTVLFSTITAFSQTSNFSRGYKEGFAKGYCYNQPITCIEKVPVFVPTPKLNEKGNSYQDGYNRGFSDGLDYKRAEISPQNENKRPEIKFNDYISQIPSNSLSILAYKEKLYSERKEWISITMDNVHNFLTTKFINVDTDEAKKWYDSMLDFQNKLGDKWPDLSQSEVFEPIKSFLSNYTKSLAQKYSSIKSEAELNLINYNIGKYESMPKETFVSVNLYPDSRVLCGIWQLDGFKLIESNLKPDFIHRFSVTRSGKDSELTIIYFRRDDSYYYYFKDSIITRAKSTADGSDRFVDASEFRKGGHGNPIFIKLSESTYVILDKGMQISAEYLGFVRYKANVYDGQRKYTKSIYGKSDCWQDKKSGEKYFLNANTIKEIDLYKSDLLITNNME